MNDLRGCLVVLLELDQFGRFFIEVDPGNRVAVIGGLLEDRASRLAVYTRLTGQRADPLDQVTIGVGKTRTRGIGRRRVDAVYAV